MRCKMILMLMPLLLIVGCDKEPVVKEVIVREVVRETAKKVLPVEHIMDSVVHIRAESASAQTYDEYTREKYGQSWQGSGCFIRSDGVILTAGHVIDGAAKIWVTLRDGTELEAKYFWQADNMDIGFIKNMNQSHIARFFRYAIFPGKGICFTIHICKGKSTWFKYLFRSLTWSHHNDPLMPFMWRLWLYTMQYYLSHRNTIWVNRKDFVNPFPKTSQRIDFCHAIPVIY